MSRSPKKIELKNFHTKKEFTPEKLEKSKSVPAYKAGYHHKIFSLSEKWVDTTGSWSWDNGSREWTQEEREKNINSFFDSIKSQSWGQISRQRVDGKQKHVHYERDKICNEALDRLHGNEMPNNFMEYEKIFRFRLGGKRRIFGFIEASGIFFFVWWDREHKIYPIQRE